MVVQEVAVESPLEEFRGEIGTLLVGVKVEEHFQDEEAGLLAVAESFPWEVDRWVEAV